MLVAKSGAVAKSAPAKGAPEAPTSDPAPIVKDCTVQQTEGSRNSSIVVVHCPSNSGTGPDHMTPCRTTRHKTRAHRHMHTHRIALNHTIRPHQSTLRKTPQRITTNATQHDTSQCNTDKTTQRKLCEQHNHTSCLILFLCGTARLQARFALIRMLHNTKVPAQVCH